MSKLDDIERRLAAEPDNLGLRVAYAGALRDEGRRAEAIEQYRAVAFAYRYQGRTQQAIAVCRGILELAPGDGRSLAMLSVLEGRAAAEQPDRQWEEETPLPRPVPYHVATPTLRQRSEPAGAGEPAPEAAPPARARRRGGARPATPPPPAPPEPLTPPPRPVLARRGTTQPTRPAVPRAELPASLAPTPRAPSRRATEVDEDLSAELETRRIPQIPPADLDKISQPPPTVPIERISPRELADLDELFTPPAPLGAVPPSDFDDIATRPVPMEAESETEDEDTGARERDDPTMPDRRGPIDD